jgi:hypothetical protein
MKAPTIILLTLSGFNGLYNGITRPLNTKYYIKETILDVCTYTIVITGIEWLSIQNSKFLKALAWVPVVTSLLVLSIFLLVIRSERIKRRKLAENKKTIG